MTLLLLILNMGFADSCFPYGSQATIESSQHLVQNYQVEMLNCRDTKNKKWTVLRTMDLDQEEVGLAVDNQSLKTQLIKISCLSCSAMTSSSSFSGDYGSLVEESAAPPYPLQNDGVTTGNISQNKVALTIDMCPSKKGISQNVYNKLVNLATGTQSPFPVGIAMTKRWLKSYPQHFEWLKEQHLTGRFDIVWINHSANHFYNAKLSLKNNFLLAANTNIEEEVFGTEVALIQAGVTPSIFFRFPGLVSSQALIEQLASWGIVALGSDAWLAKGQQPQARNSIILIHGNRNEPEGETLFLNYVELKAGELSWASLLDYF